MEIDLAGVSKKDYSFVQQLYALAGSPNAIDYRVVVVRKNPIIFERFRFICNKILKIYEVGTYQDIRDYVVQEFGGGTFEIRLIKTRGGDITAGSYDKIGSMTFMQDVKTHPPISDQYTTEGIENYSVTPGLPASGHFNRITSRGVDPESDDLDSLVKHRRKAQLKHEIWEQDSQIEDSKERREEVKLRRKIEQDREERSAALEWQSRLDSQRSQHESSMVQVMANAQKTTTDLIATLTHGNKNDGLGPMMAAIMTSMAESQKAQMEMMRLSSETRREDSAKFAEIQAESNRNMMAMMTALNTQNVEQIRASASKSEALADKLLAMRIESPDQRIEQILKAKEAGKSEAKEWFQMVEEVRASALNDASGGDDSVDWDPEAGVIGNVTALAFKGLQRLLTGPHAAAAMGMVNRLLNKPATNTQFSDREVAAAAQQMEPYLTETPPVPQLPPPINRTSGFIAGQIAPTRAQLPMPFHEPQGRPQPGMVYQTVDYSSQPPPYQPQQFVPEVKQPQINILPPDAPLPQALEDASIEPPETSEDRLRFHLSSALEECIADLQDQRHVHQWPYSAFEVLNKPFLDALVRARNETEQISLIKQYADPNVFQQWYQIFWRPGGSEHFRKVCQGIQQLINLHLESQNNAASTIAAS